MANGDNSVEIRITGAVDPSLPGATTEAEADVREVGAQAALTTNQVRDLFNAAPKDRGAMIDTFSAINSGLVTEKQAAGAVGEAFARFGETLSDSERKTRALNFATSGAIQEYIRLGHEAITGNLSRMPGSLIVLTSRMGGLTSAALGTAAAVGGIGIAIAAPLAALAYLAIKEREAEEQARALAEGFLLTGRAALANEAAQQAEIDKLSELDGVSRTAAAALVRFDSAHADLNERLAIAANQLIPAYVIAFGDKAPQALNALKAKLIEISTGSVPQSIGAFEELNKISLNLPAQSVPAIEAMIRSGNGLGAALQIVLDKAEGAHVPVQTLGQRIADTSRDIDAQKQKLAELQNAYAAAGTYGAAAFAQEIANTDAQVTKLTGDLRLLKAVQATATQAGPAKTPDLDAYVGSLRVAANLAHEGALQRRVDGALIEAATAKLRDQGKAEGEIVTSAQQARQILGAQATDIANAAAAGFVAPKGPSGAKAVNDARRIGDEIADAYREANVKRIEGEEETNSFLLEIGHRGLEQFVAQARQLEEERYQAELQGLKEREAADKTSKVALEKDLADEKVIYQEHQNRLAAIDQDYQRKKREIQQTDLQDFIKTEDDKLRRGLEGYEGDLKAHEISAQHAHDLEQQLTLAIEKEVLARFDAENAGLAAGTSAYAKAMKERQAIVDGFDAHFAQQDTKLKDEEAQKWRTLADSIRTSFNSALDDVLFHSGSAMQFLRSVAIGIAQSFLQMGEKIAEDWIEQEIKSLAATQANEAAKTAAVAAGAAAQAAARTAAATAGNAAEAAADSTSILNSAYTAAASVFKWVMQEVPFPLNVALAPVAAGAAFAAVTAFDVIKSAEGGDYRVAGGLYHLHPEEMVASAAVANPMRDFFSDKRIRDFIATPGAETAGGAASARNIQSINLTGIQQGTDTAGGAHKFDGSISGGMAASMPLSGGDTHVHLHDMALNITTPGPDAMKLWLDSTDGKRTVKKAFQDAARAGIKPKK